MVTMWVCLTERLDVPATGFLFVIR
jgi:hypothetical protein